MRSSTTLRRSGTPGRMAAPWGPRSSARAFLLGGALVAGHAVVQGIEAAGIAAPPDAFVTTGHLVALLGLAGLYGVLAERVGVAFRGAGLALAVAVAGWVAMSGAQALVIAGTAADIGAVLGPAVPLAVLGVTVVTYLAFGAATLRHADAPRRDGVLLLAPGLLMVALVVDAALTGSTPVDGVVYGGGMALSMLALGRRLATWETGEAVALADGVAAG